MWHSILSAQVSLLPGHDLYDKNTQFCHGLGNGLKEDNELGLTWPHGSLQGSCVQKGGEEIEGVDGP